MLLFSVEQLMQLLKQNFCHLDNNITILLYNSEATTEKPNLASLGILRVR